MTDNVKQFAQNCVDSMSDEDRLCLLAYPDFDLEIDDLDEKMCGASEEELRSAILELLEPHAHNYIDCSDWHLLSKEYMLCAEVADILSEEEGNNKLEDKLEAFAVPWIKYPNKYWSLPDNDTYGIFFIKVPKWKKDAAQQAFDAYYKWLCWKDPDFKLLCRKIIYDFVCGDVKGSNETGQMETE